MVDVAVSVTELGHVEDLSSLSRDEIERAASFKSITAGRSWAASRAFLRTVLAEATHESPTALVFRRSDRGRLLIDRPAPAALWFNLAHTEDVALVAVSHGAPVGVDVEDVRPFANMIDVARRVLLPAAVAAIASASPDEVADRFFREWVRHEARLKCRGTGIVEPEHDDGDMSDLTIVDLDLGAGRAAAIAVECANPRISLRQHRSTVSCR